MKAYAFGFDAWALVLFVAIMVPNLVWFAIPAPIDALRTDSITEPLDSIASVLQILMIAALCLLKNANAKSVRLTPLVGASIACALLYYACWAAYYLGIVAIPVLLGLAVFPCAAFILYALDRKNRIALALACGFAFCHLIFAIANFAL